MSHLTPAAGDLGAQGYHKLCILLGSAWGVLPSLSGSEQTAAHAKGDRSQLAELPAATAGSAVSTALLHASTRQQRTDASHFPECPAVVLLLLQAAREWQQHT